MSATPDFEALSVESATVHVQLSAWQRVRRNASVRIGGTVMLLLVLVALLAPWLGTVDPSLFDPASRDLLPGKSGEITTLEGEQIKHRFLMGSDSFGRDIYSRVIYGTQVSLIVGVSTAVVALAFGIVLGLLAGFLRWLDGPLMRVMDGLMAIPAILIAIALVALNGPSIGSVIIAITIPEMPRVVRLVRSVVLTAREEPYVEAAMALGSSTPKILFQHLLPNTMAPMIVQGTYVIASAILTEALLSVLGAGISTEIPTWGNIMAEGRQYFRINPGIILWPGLLLTICVLSINLIGDAVRDALDPRMKKREA